MVQMHPSPYTLVTNVVPHCTRPSAASSRPLATTTSAAHVGKDDVTAGQSGGSGKEVGKGEDAQDHGTDSEGVNQATLHTPAQSA